jgi:3-methyladenine DNA glycosylase AlkD
MRTPAQAARAVQRDLKALARPAGTFDARRYFRGDADFGFYNVGTARLRAMGKGLCRAHHAEWSIDDAIACADALIISDVLDVKVVAVELVACYRKTFIPRLLPIWKRWLADGYASNWATTDSICGSLIGPLLLEHPVLVQRVLPWVGHRGLWVRRAAAVSLIPPLRRGLALDSAYLVAARLHPDQSDLIHKAVGWMLREAGKADPRRLEAYLRRAGSTVPRTTVRYAIERFPEDRRKELLRVTR